MDYVKDYIDAKYHLAVAERMLGSYGEVGDKRFLVGVIREAAESVSCLIKSVMKGSRVDAREVLLRYVDGVTCDNLFRVLEVARVQRDSPVEYARRDGIILLIRGRYRILTVDRIREFVGSIGDAIGKLRQV